MGLGVVAPLIKRNRTALFRPIPFQTLDLRAKTSTLRSTVRQAESEADRVRRERADITQRWTAAVINIAKRDEVGLGLQGGPRKMQPFQTHILRCTYICRQFKGNSKLSVRFY